MSMLCRLSSLNFRNTLSARVSHSAMRHTMRCKTSSAHTMGMSLSALKLKSVTFSQTAFKYIQGASSRCFSQQRSLSSMQVRLLSTSPKKEQENTQNAFQNHTSQNTGHGYQTTGSGSPIIVNAGRGNQSAGDNSPITTGTAAIIAILIASAGIGIGYLVCENKPELEVCSKLRDMLGLKKK